MYISPELFHKTNLETTVKGFCRWNEAPIRMTFIMGIIKLAWSKDSSAEAPACQALQQYATSPLQNMAPLEDCDKEASQETAAGRKPEP